MFDSLTAAALADQFDNDIVDGRVQNVGLISRRAIALEIYANHRRTNLIASAENDAPTVYLTNTEPVLDRQMVTPLLLLIRKYVRGSRLVAVQQPPLERHLILTFAIGARKTHPADSPDSESAEPLDDEEDDAIYTHLHLEIMGRHSNIILVDDSGQIMESAKRVTPQMSRIRPIAPRRPYVPPPARDLADPRRATEADARDLLATAPPDADLARLLTGRFRGVSPQIAREAAFAQTDASVPEPGIVAQRLRHMFEPLLTSRWAPNLYLADDRIVAYAPLRLESLARSLEERSAPSISAAIETFERQGDDAEASGKHHVRAQRLVTAIQAGLDKVEAQAGSLDIQELRHLDRDQYRVWGETIFGYMWQIQPGDTELRVDDLVIPLNPGLTPSEQAREYLEQYTRGKSSDAQIQGVREELDARRAYFEQLLFLAGQASSIQDIEELEAEWFSSQPDRGTARPPRRSTGRKRTLPAMVVADQQIYIGHSGAENDRVTFDIAGPEDTWLHARGVPGSHVVVKWTPGVFEHEDVLHRAAELAAHFSQARQNNRVEVDITQRKNVRKIKGAGPGMVTYRNERTVAVSPVGPD